MIKIFAVLFLLTSVCLADVKSTTGQIKFDTNNDGQAEATLNNTGLGVGVTPSANLHVNGNAIVSDQLFAGGSSGSSNLNVNGTLGFGYESTASSMTLSGNSLVLADSSSDNLVLSLPDASSYSGRTYTIKKTSALNNVFIRDGGFIDNYSDVSLSVNNMGSIDIISSSGNWYILSLSGNGDSVSSENLIGWWKLDEASGNVISDSIGNDDGNATNMAAGNIGLTGKINNAIDFDGVDDYVETINYNIVESNFSISTWIKCRNVGPRQPFLEEDLASGKGFMVELNGSTVRFWNGYSQLSGSIGLSSDIWYLIVVTFDGTNRYLYINDVLDNSVATTFGTTSSENLNIGLGEWNAGGNEFYFGGLMDDVRIYNKALSLSEIQALYDQGQ